MHIVVGGDYLLKKALVWYCLKRRTPVYDKRVSTKSVPKSEPKSVPKSVPKKVYQKSVQKK